MQGPDQGQIGPLLRRRFFCRERFARTFCLARLQFFLDAFLCSRLQNYQVFFLKHFAVVLNYLPNDWILRGESARYWLHPVLSTRGKQRVPADD